MTASASWPVDDDTVDSTLIASRALLGVVARSVAEALQHVTLPQFRVLVLLSSSEVSRMGVLAAQMGTHPSTFSRSIDRLVAGGWVTRSVNEDNRRETRLQLSPAGRDLVDGVTARRREELRKILTGLAPAQQRSVQVALGHLSTAAGEPKAGDLLVIAL